MPDITPAPATKRYPLSAHQQARFQSIADAVANTNAALQKLVDRQSEAATIIIALTDDPESFAGWDVRIEKTEIVCTPPVAPPVAP